MKRFIKLLAIFLLLAACAAVATAQTNKTARVGYLSVVSPSADSARLEAFRQGLRELDYVENQNVLIEPRYAEGKLDRLPTLLETWSNSTSMSSWFKERKPLLLPSTQPAQLLLLSAARAISSVRASLPVWRDQEETLRALLTSTLI